jgi:hypothetical protein
VPFLAILASAGFYAVVLSEGQRRRRALLALVCFMVLALGRGLYDVRDNESWYGLMPAARKINEVTPRGAPIAAQEPIYFLTGRRPPFGMEFSYGHKVDLGPERNALFHILPQAELDREIKAGRFATAAVCGEDDRVSEVEQWKVYSQKSEAGDCTVFWQPSGTAAPQSPMIR